MRHIITNIYKNHQNLQIANTWITITQSRVILNFPFVYYNQIYYQHNTVHCLMNKCGFVHTVLPVSYHRVCHLKCKITELYNKAVFTLFFRTFLLFLLSWFCDHSYSIGFVIIFIMSILWSFLQYWCCDHSLVMVIWPFLVAGISLYPRVGYPLL